MLWRFNLSVLYVFIFWSTGDNEIFDALTDSTLGSIWAKKMIPKIDGKINSIYLVVKKKCMMLLLMYNISLHPQNRDGLQNSVTLLKINT